MFDLKLPDFEIIAWIINNEFGKKLENEMSTITKDLGIDDYSENQDKIVYHWIVPSWLETLVLGGKLKEFVGNPNLIFLKIKANNDSSIEDIAFKDEREFKK
ncbi:MAG: hypothetical protein KKE44_03765 [Proteobacteria bacterium]|nr:hypothetical protein [Pseudomonadota bacterium]MBU1581846.1 hypothetical protein [Pseudomonadota bacterium]MBU2452568.1 hypothetical protein [Pseudomonadota bacterium]MBU2630369.1 hypothetical protein [Pseudomonadota bacterium]